MGNTYYPSKDNDFANWLATFLTNATANLTALGLVTADLTPISTQQTTYTNDLLDVDVKKAALASSVQAKDATKDSLIQKIQVVVKKIQANPTVTPVLKALIGISTQQGGQYPMHPVPPGGLMANILPDGTIELDWNRNGNAPNVQFIIEYCVNGGAWTLLDVVTKTTYIHNTGHILAQVYQYLVKARKGTETSGPSNIAVAGVPIPVAPAL